MVRCYVCEVRRDGAQLFGLVNNAGLLSQSGLINWLSIEYYEGMYAVNVLGARQPLSQSAYCVSKHGMDAYSDCLRGELLDWGVNGGVQKLWEKLPKTLQGECGEDYKATLVMDCVRAVFHVQFVAFEEFRWLRCYD